MIKHKNYKIQIVKELKIGDTSNFVNLKDDHPAILFGPKVEEGVQDGDFPPFYVRLNVHDLILHNEMLDSSASHNLMPKVIMEKLGLDITRSYKTSFPLIQVKRSVWV